MRLIRGGRSVLRLLGKVGVWVAPVVSAAVCAAAAMGLTVLLVEWARGPLDENGDAPVRAIGVLLGIVPTLLAATNGFYGMVVLCDGMNPLPELKALNLYLWEEVMGRN